MQIPYDVLKDRLIRVLSPEIESRDIADLVFFSRIIVQSHLEHVRPSSLWLCRQQGMTVEDLSCDCVGDVFRRNEGGTFTTLTTFASALDLGLPGTPAAEVFFAFRKLLTTVANQHLAHLFAENDPAGGRIFRNITEALRKSRHFDVRRDIRGLVLRPRDRDPHDERPAFPMEELVRRLSGVPAARRSVSALMNVLHRLLLGQKIYRMSLPLVDVTGVFKQLYAGEFVHEQGTAFAPFDGLSESDLQVIRAEVETVVRQKVLVTYVMKGKVGVDEARAISDTFHDLLGDWIREGKPTDGMMSYLQKHQPMDEATYRSEFRPKMEYLLRIAREAFEARLVREI